MILPVLNYTKIAQLLRADVQFFVQESDLDIDKVLTCLQGIEEKQQVEIKVQQYLGSSYFNEVFSNSTYLAVLYVVLHQLQQLYPSNNTIFTLNILLPDDGILTQPMLAMSPFINETQAIVAQHIAADLNCWEHYFEESKDLAGEPIISFLTVN